MAWLGALPVIGSALDKVFGIIDEVVVDKDLATSLKAKLADSQVAMNLVEAQSSSLFVAGWRPAMGWAGVFGVVYEVIARPVASGIFAMLGYTVVFPSVESSLFEIVLGMLGLGAFRSYDKAKGTNNRH